MCKSQSRRILPTETHKRELMDKLLDLYERTGETFLVTISLPEKDIHKEQQSVYRAFIFKASEHFGNQYHEMEIMLQQFHPYEPDMDTHKLLSKWSTRELNEFILKAGSFLEGFGFHFK